MTNNEKAATFIGWQVGEHCRGCDDPSVRVIQRTNIAQVNLNVHPLHPIPAPDMSDPRHWTKAVGQRLREKNSQGTLPTAVWQALFDGDASLIVKALAALYDTEHPDVIEAAK